MSFDLPEDRFASSDLGYPPAAAGWVFVSDAVLTRSTLAHEFGGHGYLRDPAIRADFGLAALGGEGFIGEHVGDVIAMLTSAQLSPDAQPFRMTAAPGHGWVRDHSTLDCPRYASSSCDVATLGATARAQVGCREYTHADFLNNLNGPGEVHANSCVYSRLYYLLAQSEGPIVHRGVTAPGGVSRELVSELFRRMFRIDQLSARIDDYWQYSTGYRAAVGATIDKCNRTDGTGASRLAGIPECDALVALSGPARATALERLQDALLAPIWAQGFWSNELTMSGVLSETAPAVASAGPAADGRDPAGVYVVHVDPASHELLLTIYTDPVFPTRSGPPVVLGTERLAAPQSLPTARQPAIAASDGQVAVAYAEEGTNAVVILRRLATGAWVVTRPAFPTDGFHGVSVAFVGGRVLVAASPSIGNRVDFFYADSSAVEGSIAEAGRPALVTFGPVASRRTLLFYARGASATHREVAVRELGAGGTSFSGELPGLVAVPSTTTPGGEFSFERVCAAPTSCTDDASCCPGQICAPAGRCVARACASDAACSDGTLCRHGFCTSFTRSPIRVEPTDGSLSVVPLGPVDGVEGLAVFSKTPIVFGPEVLFASASVTVVRTLAASTSGFDDFRTTRQVRLEPAHEDGFAAVRFDHPTEGPILLRFGREPTSADVTFLYRRSH